MSRLARRSAKRLSVSLALTLLLAVIAQAGEKPSFKWVADKEQGTTDLLYGDAPVLRYMAASDTSTPERAHETFKVYHHVFGPGTGAIITKGPGGQYTHHRGLYIGWNKTSCADGAYDFWHCNKGERIEHRKVIDQQADAEHGSMTTLIHWNDAQGKPVIVETRSVSVEPLSLPNGDGKVNAWQIDWRTELQSERGEIQLNGDRQHAGFQYRAAQAIAEGNSARFIRPAAFPQEGAAIQVKDAGDPPPHCNLDWFAMTYELDGQRYTAEYFEDPSLPKPSLYSERPYGRFGAFFKHVLEPKAPLTMRYRVIVSAGEAPSSAEVQKRYDQFVAELKAEK